MNVVPSHGGLALAAIVVTALGLTALPAISLPAATPRPVEARTQSLPITMTDAAAVEAPAPTLLSSEGSPDGVEHDGDLVGVVPVTNVESFTLMGVTWAQDGMDHDPHVFVRHEADGTWSDWEELPHGDAHAPNPDSDEAANARPGTGPLLVPESTAVEVQVFGEAAKPPADLRIDLIHPGESPADATVGTTSAAGADAAGRPTIYSRADWGANESIRGCCVQYAEVNGGFVHHTVSSNNYSAGQVPGILRAIYEFHVNSRGWKDIGYNFLVDRFGRIWEGRFGGVDRAVMGAHTSGYNDDAFAASAIGTHTDVRVTAATLEAFKRLYAWKLDLHGVRADSRVSLDGTSLNAISGHRDVNATACPGNALYAQLPALRAGAADLQRAGQSSLVRLAGPDRFATAAAVARTVSSSATSVVIVDGRSEHLVDGLVAGPLAVAVGGPILLSSGGSLPSATRAELDRRKNRLRTAYIVGGRSAVLDSVVSDLSSRGLSVTRVWGADRYATSAAVARQVKRATGYARYWSVLASGESSNLVDALAASGPAANQERPILLTRTNGLPAVTRQVLTELAPPNLLVVGGASAVSESVVRQVRPLVGSVQRAAGQDRYGTAVAVAEAFYRYLTITDDVIVASGRTGNLVDSLSAGARAQALVLVSPSGLPRETQSWLQSKDQVRRITVVGGPAAVPESVAQAAKRAIG